MRLNDNLSQINFSTWRQISKSLFTLIFPQMLKQLMKNAEDLENLDKLLDSKVHLKCRGTDWKIGHILVNLCRISDFSNGIR